MNDKEEAGAITIYTDGACSGNPGPGGWGAILIMGAHRRELKGGEANTTNNRMELLAAIEALAALKKRASVDLFTDSTYVRQGISQWIHNWKRNGWKTADKKDVKNADLWQRLDQLRHGHDIRWHWVKGHAGHPENERADELARLGLKEALGGNGSGNGGAAAVAPPAPAPAFELDTRLAADTIAIYDLPLCALRLMNERRYPWLILVPQRPGLAELTDLSEADSAQLMKEIRQASSLLKSLFACDKLNVGALGNIVRQLHVHIVARKDGDPAWPGPVWGHSPVEPYNEATLELMHERLRGALNRP